MALEEREYNFCWIFCFNRAYARTLWNREKVMALHLLRKRSRFWWRNALWTRLTEMKCTFTLASINVWNMNKAMTWLKFSQSYSCWLDIFQKFWWNFDVPIGLDLKCHVCCQQLGWSSEGSGNPGRETFFRDWNFKSIGEPWWCRECIDCAVKVC